MTPARLIFPHQLFTEHFHAPAGTLFVLVEDDLFFRQYAFHAFKLVLHRASMRAFADQLAAAGHQVRYLETSAEQPSMRRLAALLRAEQVTTITCFDVVDDWLSRRVSALTQELGVPFTAEHVLESPNFVTTRAEFAEYFNQHGTRMQDFYIWQRKRLTVLLDGDQPVGGKWSYDAQNRKKLPKNYVQPRIDWPEQTPAVTAAIAFVQTEFPNAPGIAHLDDFAYPTTHAEASAALADFLQHRFNNFGPYEDAMSAHLTYLNHSVITPGLNVGLLNPHDVLHQALDAAEAQQVPLPSVEGFVRQVIGWREYMRATYHLWGRSMRTRNALGHQRSLSAGWWTGQVAVKPLDIVLKRVLRTGYCHHIERLMVLGNAMCLLRSHPDEVYEWFMALFVDAYDWVMVPNVYAMSQFACGDFITTKPYVSGSNYLKKMSDFGPGDWQHIWDGWYWTFVRDHRAVFESNFRSKMVVSLWDRMTEEQQCSHVATAAPWLALDEGES